MTAVLTPMPGVQTLSFTGLSIPQKTAEIEQLATVSGLTPHMTDTILRTVAHPSLVGEALLLAWLKAEDAIQIRDATDPADWDYEMYAGRAADAICDLIHGTNISTARGSGITPRGNAS